MITCNFSLNWCCLLNMYTSCSPWSMEEEQVLLAWQWCQCFYLMGVLDMSCKHDCITLATMLSLGKYMKTTIRKTELFKWKLLAVCTYNFKFIWIKLQLAVTLIPCLGCAILNGSSYCFSHCRQQSGAQPHSLPAHHGSSGRSSSGSRNKGGSSSRGRHGDGGHGQRYRPY